MIISGLQTGRTRWLASHLQNEADNEEIDLAEIRGTIAHDIDGALAEFDAYTAGTKAREGVYAAFINPPEALSKEQYLRALEVIEEQLGLSEQPRIVLFHVKKGRHHCHVVWSRIDLKNMKAIQLSFDRQKLRRCAQILSAEFCTELPPGLKEDRGAERFDDRKRPSKAEKSMAEVSGLCPEQRRDIITDCYWRSDSAASFVDALEAAGYMLAKGDRRSFVVVDIAGDVHALARQVDGAKTRAIKKKLEGINLSSLLPVERARVLMAQRAQAQKDVLQVSEQRRYEAKQAAQRIRKIHKQRRAKLDQIWQKMKVRHMQEEKVLLAKLKRDEKLRLRRHWTQFGLARYLAKIAVIRQLIEYYADKKRKSLEEYHRQLKESLKRRHQNEERELRRRYEALYRLEAREEKSIIVFYGTITASSHDQPISYFYSNLVGALGDQQVNLSFDGCQQFEGWEDASLYLPDDIPASGSGQTAIGGYDDATLTTNFNINASAIIEYFRTNTDTEDEQAGVSSHGPALTRDPL